MPHPDTPCPRARRAAPGGFTRLRPAPPVLQLRRVSPAVQAGSPATGREGFTRLRPAPPALQLRRVSPAVQAGSLATGREGFTLLEVLFATIVLGIAIVGIAQGFSAGIRANTIAHGTSIALELSRTKLAEYDAGVTPVTQNDEGDFDSYGYPEFKYRVDSRTTPWTGLYELVLTVEWPDRGETRSFVTVQWMLDRQAGALAGIAGSTATPPSSTKTGTSGSSTKK